MKLSYRNHKNAQAIAAFWKKPLDRADWYEVKAQSDDEAEILIYDVIGWPFNDAAELVRTLAEMKQQKIVVRINSPGGDVFDAMSLFNAIQSHKSKIVTRIESLAASAASFVALAGKEVQSYKNAMIMIHSPWAYVAGNQHELRDVADILGKIEENMVDIYSSNSNVGKKEIREMLKAETWLTAKEASERGFVDTIIDGKAPKAKFDLSVFNNVPDDLRENRDHELTERDAEKALRDAGFSRSKAKALLAGRQPDAGNQEIDGVAAEIKKSIAILGG